MDDVPAYGRSAGQARRRGPLNVINSTFAAILGIILQNPGTALRAVLTTLIASGCCSAQISAVLNGASFSGMLAPGAWAAIFGTNLAETTAIASSIPLPTTLGGVSVTFNGLPAPLSYVSPTQINAVMPFEVVPPTDNLYTLVTVRITNGTTGARTEFLLGGANLRWSAPALFTRPGTGSGAAFAFDSKFQYVNSSTSAPIILYAAGLGLTTPPADARPAVDRSR